MIQMKVRYHVTWYFNISLSLHWPRLHLPLTHAGHGDILEGNTEGSGGTKGIVKDSYSCDVGDRKPSNYPNHAVSYTIESKDLQKETTRCYAYVQALSGYAPSAKDSWALVKDGSALEVSLPASSTLYNPSLLLGNPALRNKYKNLPGGVLHPAMAANARSVTHALQDGQLPSHKVLVPLPVPCVDVSTIEESDTADEGAPMVSLSSSILPMSAKIEHCPHPSFHSTRVMEVKVAGESLAFSILNLHMRRVEVIVRSQNLRESIVVGLVAKVIILVWDLYSQP